MEPEQGSGAAAFDDELLFGPGFVEAMVQLEREGLLDYRRNRWFYSRGGHPAQDVSLDGGELPPGPLTLTLAVQDVAGWVITRQLQAVNQPDQAGPTPPPG